jgi:uncharacterized C2H2 Zn-finger protein
LDHRTLGRASSDQESTTSTLQSCLGLLDRHCDRLQNTYKEILEIRTCIAEILANLDSQSEVAMENVGARDSSIDLIFSDGPPTIAPVTLDANSFLSIPPTLSLLSQPLVFSHGQPSAQEHRSLSQSSVGVIGTLPEGTESPVYRFAQGELTTITAFQLCSLHEIIEPLLTGASGSVSHELGTQPLQKFLPEDDTCSEGQTLSGPSARHYQRLYLPMMQDGKDKVKCMWPECSSVIKKDSYIRHVNEVHKRQVKAVCTTCGKKFPRPYMKKTHICPGRYSKRSNS